MQTRHPALTTLTNATLATLAVTAFACGPSSAEEPPAEEQQAALAAALPVTVSTDKRAYSCLEPVHVSFTGMAGNQSDWLGIAPDGSPPTTFEQWAFTKGAKSGAIDLHAPPGTWVARAFFNDGYVLEGQSLTFTVDGSTCLAPSIATDRAQYAGGDVVRVSFAGMAGFLHDWVDIAPARSASTLYSKYRYTGHVAPTGDRTAWVTAGEIDSTQMFNYPGVTASALPDGTYVARAFFNNSDTIAAESVPFVVCTPAAPPSVCAARVCGTAGDGCGGTVSCGVCDDGYVCRNGSCRAGSSCVASCSGDPQCIDCCRCVAAGGKPQQCCS